MPARLPSLLADPPPAPGRLWLTGGRLFDGTGGPVREHSGVLVENGTIVQVRRAADGVPDGAAVIELAGRTLTPGLIDSHARKGRPSDRPARSVELEDPDPPQLTRAEIAALVEEAHRQGYRVAAHAEGIAGTEIAIQEGVDTIEHGMYLNQRPDLLEQMATTARCSSRRSPASTAWPDLNMRWESATKLE